MTCRTDAIGHVIRGVYDGILYWSCPRCERIWHRWLPGTGYYDRAERYLSAYPDIRIEEATAGAAECGAARTGP